MKISLILYFSLMVHFVNGQVTTIYYTPVKMPAALKNDYFGGFDPKVLAEDLSRLLCCATGKTFNTAPFSGEKPGIFLLLDTSLRDSTNETGHVTINKKSISIRSKYTTGISFAMYGWLRDLGFRFYLPGEVWMEAPVLKDLFQPFEKTYSPHFKLRLFNASGGVFPVTGIDDSGMVKKEWETWYRRNRMGSDYLRIDGHKGELFNIVHQKEIESDPAILAPFEGKRKYAVGAKIDPTYKKGVDLFSSWLSKEFQQQQKTLPDFLPYKKYQSADMGDGLNYCHTPACESMFHTVSDQAFYLVNEAAKKIRKADVRAGISTLAYTERADTPSSPIEPNVHVMVVPAAFQQVSNAAELVERWTKKHPLISQYDFLNIGVWNYDHPFFNLSHYHSYLQWLKSLGIEGMSFETSLSSMASGVQQYFLMQYLAQPYEDIEAEFDQFCRRLFGNATAPVKRIFKAWYFSDAHLKTSIEKPSFYPDELAMFTNSIREAENTKGLTQVELERIYQLKAYITYLCAFYDLYHETAANAVKSLSPTDVKAEAVLAYTWSLYDTKIFHNTQLGDLLKKSTSDPQQWDFRNGNKVRNVKPLTKDKLEKIFSDYEKKYSFNHSVIPNMNEEKFQALTMFSADSFRIKTIDEKAFGSYVYPLKIFAPKTSLIKIRYSVGKGEKRKSNGQPLALMTLEKNGGQILGKHLVYQNDQEGYAVFNIPGPGHYTVQLGQFHATPVQWVIFPNGNLFYIEKKQVIHHAIRLMEEKGSLYANTQLGIWNEAHAFYFQPLFSNVKNTASFYSAEGEQLNLVRNTGKNLFMVETGKSTKPFSFYRNEVMRWPVILQNIPPFFFFLDGRKN